MMRGAIFAAVVFATVTGVAQSAPPAGAPFELDAIIPGSGSAAFLGKSYLDAFRALENRVNASGGINGKPLKIVTFDSATTPQTGVQLVNGLVAKGVSVFIDGGPVSVCNASAPLVAQSGPVDYCLSPLIQPSAGSFVFSAGADSLSYTKAGLRYYRESGVKRIAVIATTDASGQVYETQTDAAMQLPEFKDMQIVANEKFAPGDVSAAAQLTRIKAANPQGLIVYVTGTPLATVLRAIQDSGLDVPVQILSSNAVYAQMSGYKSFLPRQLLFTTVLALTTNDPPPGPVGDQQRAYFAAFKGIGVRPDYLDNVAWDPIMIVVDALRHLGTHATAEQIRQYIEHLHGWVGVNGTYDFVGGDQRGIGDSSTEVARWDAQKDTWVRASLPGGQPLGVRGAQGERK
jgi:branched-chain amino acid transport system substrate-binding protein